MGWQEELQPPTRLKVDMLIDDVERLTERLKGDELRQFCEILKFLYAGVESETQGVGLTNFMFESARKYLAPLKKDQA
jgi:hypothetical protein